MNKPNGAAPDAPGPTPLNTSAHDTNEAHMQQSTDTVDLQAVAVADDHTPQRNALMHALSEAEQVVSQLHTVPTDLDIRADSVTGVYSLSLYFTRNHASVMEFAQLFGAEDVSSSPSTYTPGVFLEAVARYKDTTVRAWTIVDEAPDPDGPPSDRPVDEDPIAYSLTEQTEQAEQLANSEAGQE